MCRRSVPLLLLAAWLCLSPSSAAAQDEAVAPPSPPPSYVSVDRPPSPYAQPAPVDPAADSFAADLLDRRERLLKSRRRWLPSLIALGVGALTLVTGGIVFQRAWDSDPFNVTQDRAGLVMMPTGAAITIGSGVTLFIRLMRTRRLARLESRMRDYGLIPAPTGP